MAEKVIKVRVAELLTGDIIAKDILSTAGSILVKKDTAIDELIIQKLLRSYNDYIIVYRKVSDSLNSYKMDVERIILKEIEDIIDNTSKKFIKQDKDINQIKKILFEILNNNNTIKLLIPIRPLGENVFNHSINVAIYAMLVGREMFMPYNRLKTLGTAALLHDIGMKKIPREIIYKTQSLNEDEKKILMMHPRYSFEILQETNKFNLEVTSIVLQHHERFDGKGYPNGIKKDRIHEMAKIISVCDIFDALTSDRPYRQKFEKSVSLEYLLKTGENSYSPEIIQSLVNSISIYPYGKWVKISTGEIGIIVSNEADNSLNHRPTIMLYIDSQGNDFIKPIIMDLSLKGNEDIVIEEII